MASPLSYEQVSSREWFDLDPSLDYPQGDLDNDLTAFVDSISPQECDLLFPDTSGTEADSMAGLRTESWFSDFVSYDSHDNSSSNVFNNMEPFPSQDHMYEDPGQLPNMGLSDASFQYSGDSTWNDPILYDSLYDLKSSIRPVVEAQAAADTSCMSKKEKKMEASIEIYMNRMQESTTNVDVAESNTSLSSPCSFDDVSPGSTGINSSTTDNASTPNSSGTAARGVELVLDMNMNSTADLPRKHKPRSQAQKDNYIKARKYGACEKHRKQHKRCNCTEIKANRIGELAFAGQGPIQLQIPKPLQVHSPQSQLRTSLVPSPKIATSDLPSPQSATMLGSGKNIGKQASNHMPRCSNSDQQVCATPDSAGQFSVPGSNRQTKLQARAQSDLAVPRQAVNTIYPASQAVHPGKIPIAGCPVPQQLQACYSATLRTNHTPAGASTPMESTCIVHIKQYQNDAAKMPTQPSHLPSTARDTLQYRANTGYSAWNVGQFIHKTMRTSSCWRAFSTLASLTGATFGHGIVACLKQYWLLKA